MTDSKDDSTLSGGRSVEFMDLLAPIQDKLFGFIFALVVNADDAHDLYQQTVMVMWRKFDVFRPGTNFGAWALKVAQLEVLQHRRTAARSRLLFNDDVVEQLVDTQAKMAERPMSDMRFEFLQECLTRLKRIDHELVEMCYCQGVQIQQVASNLGRSSQSVCNSLRRIRISLLSCIDRKQARVDHQRR